MRHSIYDTVRQQLCGVVSPFPLVETGSPLFVLLYKLHLPSCPRNAVITDVCHIWPSVGFREYIQVFRLILQVLVPMKPSHWI